MELPPENWQPPKVRLQTSMGDIDCELYWHHAPRTCTNFAELARRGYYDNIKFHRVIRGFMLQSGDPTGTGRGGSSIYGLSREAKELKVHTLKPYTPLFEDEIHRELKHTGAGILSMANSGPSTNGSQFFITLAPAQWLDGKHSVFGRISAGMGIVKRIGMVETDPNDRPTQDVYIIKASPLNS